jgi:TPR repeat protein
MNFDDSTIDSIIWNCIEQSLNPDDFKAYIEHQPANSPHIVEAENRILDLQNVSEHSAAKFPEVVARIEELASKGDRSAQFHMGKFYDNGKGVIADSAAAASWYEKSAENGDIRAAHNLACLKLIGSGVDKDVPGAISTFEKTIALGSPLGAEALADYFLKPENKDIVRAIGYLRKAFELGSLSAGHRLGRVLYYEAESPVQREEAKKILLSLVEQDYLPAAKSLAYIYSEGNRSDRNYEAARNLHLRLLDSGQKEAMLSLGWLDLETPPETGDGPDRLHWFKKAWEAELFKAAGYIGRAYLYGEGIEKSVDEAIHWFTLGSDRGEHACAYYMGLIHEKGLNGSASDRTALAWYRKAAESGLNAAQIALARIFIRDTGVPVDGIEAVKWLDLAIQDEDTEAMLLLAHIYKEGVGVIKNERAAFELVKKAALAGNLVGQSETGWRLCKGIGCEENIQEGLSWHKKAAESGRAYDQGLLAYAYLYRHLSLEQDFDEAFKWARLSATQGEELGQFVLGECYRYGYGVAKDRNLAIEWLKKSANQGYVRAQAELAEVFYEGEDGGNRDFLEAGRWASLAADAGHPIAQLLLGRMFLFGEQVEADAKAAVQWFQLAANQEVPEAMYWLGQLTADGIGTKRDWIVALKWLKKAADEGITSAVTSLKAFGVEYIPGSQSQHRLSPEDPIAIDGNVDPQLFVGDWECVTDELKMTSSIRADGSFSSEAEVGSAEMMISSGRWAVREGMFIWDAWESNIPLDGVAAMDDRIDFVSPEELHLTGVDGETMKFKRITRKAETQNQVLKFPTSRTANSQ